MLQVRRREELPVLITLQRLEEATPVEEVVGEIVVVEEVIQEEVDGIRYRSLVIECTFPRYEDMHNEG